MGTSSRKSRSRNSKSRKNMIKKMSNRVRKVSRNVRRMGRKLVKRSRSKGKRTSRYNSRRMRGGAIEYSPLPCDSNGNTDWNSTQQVGHETCVEYGTDGAENDARMQQSYFSDRALSGMSIQQTIQDTVDEALRDLATRMVGMDRNDVRQSLQVESNNVRGGTTGRLGVSASWNTAEARAEAARVVAEREAARQTTSV